MAAPKITWPNQQNASLSGLPQEVVDRINNTPADQKFSADEINQVKTVVNSHADLLDGLAARPDIAQLTADFPSAGAGTATLRIIESAFVGSLDFFASANVTGISYQKNGSPATLPVTVALNDTLVITATASAPGYVKLRRV